MRSRQHFRHEGIADIAYGMEMSVYLVGFDNGMVKVGRTSTPRGRLENLSHQARRLFGCQVTALQVFPTGRSWVVETDAIRRLRAVASNVDGRREYFTGITFDSALAVVRAAIPA